LAHQINDCGGMAIVSVDLAYRDYQDFGVAILDLGPNGATYELASLIRRKDARPTPDDVADMLIEICSNSNALVILLDGPQGWKDPSSDLTHCRKCERILNTPAKTGLPGIVKPASYFGFVEFSIQVFNAFDARGWKRFDPANWRGDYPTVIESFPLSAWRSLSLPPLPAKSKSADIDIIKHLRLLGEAGYITNTSSIPTHDELQAVVAGLGGLGLIGSNLHRWHAAGVPPFVLDHSWREGYIVNPGLLPQMPSNFR
jgi:hypothetical protein